LHGDCGEIARPSSLRPCPYRRAAYAISGAPAHYVCECAGGVPIGSDAAEDPLVMEICSACNLPAEIDPSRRTCLFLIPVRLWEGSGLRTGFSCRWFYNLKPGRLPGEAWLCCLGCPHWFPRPPDEADIPRMKEWIHKIIRLYWEPETPGGIWNSPLPAKDPGDTSVSLLREKLSLRIKRFREALWLRRDRRAMPVARAEE
jgi:hypothetical protein